MRLVSFWHSHSFSVNRPCYCVAILVYNNVLVVQSVDKKFRSIGTCLLPVSSSVFFLLLCFHTERHDSDKTRAIVFSSSIKSTDRMRWICLFLFVSFSRWKTLVTFSTVEPFLHDNWLRPTSLFNNNKVSIGGCGIGGADCARDVRIPRSGQNVFILCSFQKKKKTIKY